MVTGKFTEHIVNITCSKISVFLTSILQCLRTTEEEQSSLKFRFGGYQAASVAKLLFGTVR
ncbi:hypothetical protein M514_08641 [Trichuris suis]|uniref:Uncharacterized protein n=1 Tax=Trichuris suis TaxID=68888 RepID=A0A085LZL8_9BILA|nr:hypothetical protein M513_08641 [Trichuris suis]KFD64035.1 hypothetical protein M514_08641 [Trichuris suis]